MKTFITVVALGYVIFHILYRIISGRKTKIRMRILFWMFVITLVGYSFRGLTLPALRTIFWYAQRIMDILLGNVVIK